MRSRRHAEEVHQDSHGIDLAPMLDFVLNLLIFFIIIAVFVKQSGLTVQRPTGEPPPKNADKSIAIQVLENGEVWVDGRVIDPEAVRANVERMHAVGSQGRRIGYCRCEGEDRSCRYGGRSVSSGRRI